MAAGTSHTCGIRTDGEVACWGDNDVGQSSPPPGPFTDLGAGLDYTCGVRNDGTLACWGENGFGQSSPPSGTFTRLSAGNDHACGVRTDGPFECWGANSFGQASPPSFPISPASLPNGSVGNPYSVVFSANGGTPPYTFTVIGTLPPGLSLTPGGTLEGTPTAAGTFSFTIHAVDADDAASTQPYTLQIEGHPTSGTIPASKDSFLRASSANANEGANPRLLVSGPDRRRAVVAFDLEGVDRGAVAHARLILTIATNDNGWSGVDDRVVARPLVQDFTEGNGRWLGVPEADRTRGVGSGTTWKCATDTNIANTVRNCAAVWNGGASTRATGPAVEHFNGLSGDVEWDVTRDVRAGASAWVLKKMNETLSGGVRYYSREGSLVRFGDLRGAPRIIIE